MPCPHSFVGEPKSCSQCLGAVPKKVVYDEKLGTLTVDGLPAARAFRIGPKYGEQQQMERTVHVKRGRGRG